MLETNVRWQHSRAITYMPRMASFLEMRRPKTSFFAQAGREHFDGKGGMSGIYSGNFNGTIVRGSYSGTYAMKADCSGTVTFADNLKQVYHYDVFAAQGGGEFVFVQTDPNSITSAYERRRVAP